MYRYLIQYAVSRLHRNAVNAIHFKFKIIWKPKATNSQHKYTDTHNYIISLLFILAKRIIGPSEKNNYSGKFIEKSLVGALLKRMVNVGAKPKSVASFFSFFFFFDHSFYVRLTDNFMEISVRSKNVHSSFFCFAVYDKSSLLKYWPEQNWKWIQTFTKADLQPILSHVELILFSESFNWFQWFFNFQNRHKFQIVLLYLCTV